MAAKRTFLMWWIGGLVMFALSIALHAPLNVDAVPGGILDHQTAPDGAAVDAIHAAWKSAGVFDQVALAMFSDILFIQIYSFGALLGGRYFFAKRDRLLRPLGAVVMFAAGVFYITDMGETVSQIIQVLQDAGSDNLATLASTLQPIKSASFVVTFVGIVAALIAEKLRA